jgi:hypothetical protein
MRAEDLIELAGGHGIDLVGAAQRALRTDGMARPRRLTFQERLAGIEVGVSAAGGQSRTMKRPVWTEHDLGHALAGCPFLPDRAAWFAFGRDDRDFGKLYRALMARGIDLSGKERWPDRFEVGEPILHYLPTMTTLVFEVERHAQFHAVQPLLLPLRLGVSTEVWFSRVAGRFASLQSVYYGWLQDALTYIQASLSGRPRRPTGPIDRRAPRN